MGDVYLPVDPAQRLVCEQILESVVHAEGQRVVGWRDVPTDPAHVGRVARSSMPVFRQLYVRMRRVPPSGVGATLYVIRKLRGEPDPRKGIEQFHIASLSTETIVYRACCCRAAAAVLHGPARARDRERDRGRALAVLDEHVPDVGPRAAVPLHRAQRRDQHGARQRQLDAGARSQLRARSFHGGLDRLFPIIVPGKSDSAQFDNMVELLTLGGRTLPHAMMMMIPEAWESRNLDEDRTAFYRYAASLVEPWDGPAAIVFSDGQLVGATLDPTGCAPHAGRSPPTICVILASEAGVIDVPPSACVKGAPDAGHDVRRRYRGGPHRRRRRAQARRRGARPVSQVARQERVELGELEIRARSSRSAARRWSSQQCAFGYTDEELELIVEPMAQTGKEPIGSMGTDTPLAVLSDRAPNLSAYFQPAVRAGHEPADRSDPRGARDVARDHDGPDGNTFDETPEQCHQLRLRGPVIDNRDLAKIRRVREGVLIGETVVVPSPRMARRARGGQWLCRAATVAYDDGENV